MQKPSTESIVPVTVFSDYICPFCYIGDRRLAKVRQQYPLNVNWRFLEIHPGTPPEGMPLSALGYPPAQWQRMMENLMRMADEEGIHIAERTFTTNSHRALLLAQAAQAEDQEKFLRLNDVLFEAFFGRRLNIAEPDVLMDLAREAGIAESTVERAWTDSDFENRLRQTQADAARMGISGTPTFVIGRRALAGAVPVSALAEAVRDASAGMIIHETK